MKMPDLINGLFELLGGFLVWLNVLKLYKDKEVKGVHLGPMAFFLSWSLWNLYFYRHLHQYLSWFGGMLMLVANAVWLSQAVYYSRMPPYLIGVEPAFGPDSVQYYTFGRDGICHVSEPGESYKEFSERVNKALKTYNGEA